LTEPTSPRRHWPYLLLGALVLLAAVCGASLGYFMRFDLPDVRALEDYRPPEMSRVLAADGSQVGTFAEERRILIRYGEIPPVFQRALIATEDANFYGHTGIDFKGIARALWRDVSSMSLAQGASTLTQQLARNLFLHPDKTIRRKLQEAFLALEIERQFTKQEILGFYCNQIYMGHGRWGLEAAARYYFGKTARELSLAEAATLAGVIQRPEALSPFKHPDRALRRRGYVLRRMVDEEFLSPHEAAAAEQEPLGASTKRRQEQIAPYYIEEVRRWIQEHYGSSSLYREGLEVRTTLDRQLQRFANESMDLGLRQLDKRQGWRGVAGRIPRDEDPLTWSPPSWERGVETGRVLDGVVVALGPDGARVRVGAHEGRLGSEEIAWTKQEDPAKLLASGDIVRVRLVALDDAGGAELKLEQEPLAEAALIAIEPATGAVRALVGGFDFERSEWDRAMQSRRQTGSAFKPLIYAAALASGLTLTDTLLDEPTVFLDPRKPEPYQPENYTNRYYGTITLRTALEKSSNIATVKLLDQVGYSAVIETARRLGIGGDLQPFPSLALGVFGSTLMELTAAYGTFGNQGVLVEPHLVEEVLDSDGSLVERVEPAVRDAVGPQIAYLMNRVLSGVITDGTGRAAARLGYPLAGKTGTTDNNTDAWFIGYSPSLAVGVWVGFDEPTSLGSRETGALAALPIWQAFMERAMETLPAPEFERPPGMTIVSIDRATGLKANLNADCGQTISEVFITGTEPTEYCSADHHRLLELPYAFQRYALDEQGELMIPANQLEALLREETSVYLVRGEQRLETYTRDGAISLPFRLVPAEESQPVPVRLREKYDVSEWIGKDGRIARVRWLK